MPSFRDRERDEAEAQAEDRGTARELKKRAAKRAKERAKAGLGATTSATGNTMGAAARGVRERERRSHRETHATRRGRPSPKPARVGAPPAARDALGPRPSEWTGDVGSELVTLQAQISRSGASAKVEAERKGWKTRASRRDAQYGRQAAPRRRRRPSRAATTRTRRPAQSPKSPKPRPIARRESDARAAGGREMYRLKSSRPGLILARSIRSDAFRKNIEGLVTRLGRRPRAGAIDSVFGGTKTRLRRWTEATRDCATRAIRARPRRRAVSGGHRAFRRGGQTALMLAEMRASRARWRTCARIAWSVSAPQPGSAGAGWNRRAAPRTPP